MRFAHMADCHVGGWREPRMKEASLKAFIRAIDICIEREVDFVLCSGDIFNSAVPSVDILKAVFMKLDDLRKSDIPFYYIPGSHDFSPSGATMLDLIELAGLGKNAMKGKLLPGGIMRLSPLVDEKTGARISGMFGRKGGLERELLKNLEFEDMGIGYMIFMFHTAITELKTKELSMMESMSMKYLPKGFDYYAGGHVHIIGTEANVAYPGPLFPNSFSEFEKLENGGFYIVEDGNMEYVPIIIHKHLGMSLDCKGKSPEAVTDELLNRIRGKDLDSGIVTLRIYGALEGKVSDIDMSSAVREIYSQGAYFVMKSTSGISVPEMDMVILDDARGDIESFVIDSSNDLDKSLFASLLSALSIERGDGERLSDFETRIRESAKKALGLNTILL